MPCGRISSDDNEPYRVPDNENSERMRREIANLEVLLCSACRALMDKQFDFDINPELSQWWSRHKQYDDRRIQQERAAEEKKRREIEQCEALVTKPWCQLTTDDRQLLKKHGYA